MPDIRKHRGPHPADGELFAAKHHSTLRQAVADLSWLWTRGYSQNAALKLVGDRFQLTERQRLAVARSACSDQSLARRSETHCDDSELAGGELHIDGFNLLTTIEAALAGGVLLIGRDGCIRDMASMHGSYRKVAETIPAIEAIGRAIAKLRVDRCRLLFDQPVSNSGRISQLVRETAAKNGWHWDADLLPDPDAALIASDAIVVSADSVVIDGCQHWFNLAARMLARLTTKSIVIDLRLDGDSSHK